MAWLVGIIVAIFAIRFWRISLPLLGVAALGIGGLLLYENQQSENRKAERERTEVEIAQQVRDAKANASADGREWAVRWRQDPASEKLVPSSAVVQSNDGLCNLSVEKRITGAELTGIYCNRLKVSFYKDIQVKFDNYDSSNTMRIDKFNDSETVYIPSYQYTYSNQLEYKEFLRRLRSGKAVSLRLDTSNAGSHWITFTLKGSSEALAALYGQN